MIYLGSITFFRRKKYRLVSVYESFFDLSFLHNDSETVEKP